MILLGSFNPRIFDPLWLADHNLVAEEEAVNAERELIDRDFSRIALPWMELVVLQDRLQAQTTSETVNSGQIRDLLVGILRLLPHIPIDVGSIHHRADVAISTEEEWHAIGHALAPKDLWQGVLDQPGMFDFAMQGVRPDDRRGAIKVRIQPSKLVQPGIMLNVNDEFAISESSESERVGIAELLDAIWPEAETRALEIRKLLLERLIP